MIGREKFELGLESNLPMYDGAPFKKRDYGVGMNWDNRVTKSTGSMKCHSVGYYVEVQV